MGRLFYASGKSPVEVPDRMLAHLKAVIVAKLRRGESFTLSWDDPDDGAAAIWLSPAIELRFVFDAPEPETLDPAWLHELAAAAGSSKGLRIELESNSGKPAQAPAD